MNTQWPPVPLGDLLCRAIEEVNILVDQTYRLLTVGWWGKGVVERKTVNGSEIASAKLSLVRPNDFIISRIDARKGACDVIAPVFEGAVVTNDFPVYRVNSDRLLPPFLKWLSKTEWFIDLCNHASEGTTNRVRLQEDRFLAKTIPVPPLSEQRRIVARIEELMSKIADARELHRQSCQERDALKNSVAYALFDPARLGNFPVHNLGEVADIQSGVTLGRTLTGPTVRLPYLRVANVQDGHLDLRQIKDVDVLETEAEKWLLQRGDVLLTEGGDWDKLGRGTVWAEEIPNCIHQNHIFRVRVDPDRFDPYFLAAYIGSPHGKLYFQQSAKKTTNLASINQRQLKAFRVFEPPLAVQRQMIKELVGIELAIRDQKSLDSGVDAEMDALVPSILDKAFRGEL
jgi:type I restriction enzyme S subunit